MQRRSFRSVHLAAYALGLATFLVGGSVHAQVAGTAGRPLPDIMLLVDNSGSMERMPNKTLPTCNPGTESEPNRWGIVLQALTGNIQPYFSCAAVSRTSNPQFDTRYGIASQRPYDSGYPIPYHQPLANTGTNLCAITPWRLPGAPSGQGVGPNSLGDNSVNADAFPDEALAYARWSTLGSGVTSGFTAANQCNFEQTNDGQLDVAKTYARFGLMMFDGDTHGGTGLTPANKINTARPFEGLWSYLRLSGSIDYTAPTPRTCTSASPASECPPAVFTAPDWARGRPSTTPVCLFSPQEVGARNAGAPPWEGRLVPFANPNASIYDLAAQNEKIQQVLLASRPYGATPIDGMLDDARTFFWNDPAGPSADPYGCRDRYIILLTDGAPNLDLRTTTGCTTEADCPYQRGGTIAKAMFDATGNRHVKTFVIGFSVEGSGAGEGFPTGITSCKSWFDSLTTPTMPERDKALAMAAACAPMPAEGTTANACCKLNEIALQGDERGAFFAESQADVVLAFGRILANVINSAGTRTIPVTSPSIRYNAASFYQAAPPATATAASGQFLGSFIPSSQVPWSGELDRTRFVCNASNVAAPVAQDRTRGDYMAENLAVQSADTTRKRRYITVLADAVSARVDSSASIRPFANRTPASSTGADAIGKPGSADPTYSGTEISSTNALSLVTANATFPDALNVTPTTCRRGRAVKKKSTGATGTLTIPALPDVNECSQVVLGFAAAVPDSMSFPTAAPAANRFEFNVRCPPPSGTPSAGGGTCSISGSACNPSTVNPCPDLAGNPSGEVCVPECTALGAVFHSNPAISAPPQNLLREEGFRTFQQNRAARRTALYVATTDGVLHAFNALSEGAPNTQHELWAFIPPAVLPRLASNYPGGNQFLLDGSPVVREVVWDRLANATTDPASWHTTLVAGLGAIGGYYAMNVTDADCGSGNCEANYAAPAKDSIAEASTGGEATPVKRGPRFLWQLTDVPRLTPGTDNAKIIRTSKLGNTDMVALFGKNTSTPAVGTVVIRDSALADHLVGIAILPGGYDDAPVKDETCPRRVKPTNLNQSGASYAELTPRTAVRKWARGPCTTPVPGRGVTIVRLDNGEVIAHFGRTDQDVPGALAATSKAINTAFDSPMVGTPVVYPDQPGVPIQKVFIGDADGTLWRIDLTNTNPTLWRANLFSDLYARPAPGGLTSPPTAELAGQPIQIPPVLSLDETGTLIVNVATGDQENIIYNGGMHNFVASIAEARDSASFPRERMLWYEHLVRSERVTGPMAVFDRVLYFATHAQTQPAVGAVSCTGLGVTKMWGLHYIEPTTTATPGSGGRAAWCRDTDIDTLTGLCTTTVLERFVVPVDAANQPITEIIPGVALTASQACVTNGGTDEYGNQGYSNVTQTQYNLSFGISRAGGVGKNAQADRNTVRRPLPRVATKIDSWSIVLQ